MATPLGTDAATAFRLAMDPDGTAPIARMMAVWNIIDRHDPRHTTTELPEDMRREGDRLVSDQPREPLRLSVEEILTEAFRLSGLHRAPDAVGWHLAGNITRTANGLGIREALAAAGDERGATAYLRTHPMFETRQHGDVLFIRHRLGDPEKGLDPVVTEVVCPGDEEPRVLGEQPSFGAAFRALLAMPRDLVATGTWARFHRGGESRTAIYDAADRWWIMADGTRMRRRDPTDPILHHYRHGHLVEAVIGFVSKSKSGRIFATVGRPVDEPGDNDAFIHVMDRKEAATVDQAHALLDSRGDLDHIFEGVQSHSGTMGFWLGCLAD